MADPEAGGESRQYRVLARKYRPTTFAELIGQDAMVRTLTNALRSGRIAQAYMLSGVRGVGKTTTARILARALNCIGPDGRAGPTPEPCGVCEVCRAITADRHLDVIEMDAASRTKVEEIRDLLDGVPYRPTSARYKVYIVDEVHMLSGHSFNALLKTLEEPPEHVKFVFATTEIRKVPVTVLSRCQRFDLRRIEVALVARHLRDIAGREGVVVSEEALHLIARAADGSVRDGLSLLDQAIALGEGTVAEAGVREMLGLIDRTVTFDLFEAVMRGETATALALLEGQYAAGADSAAVLEDLLDLTHWITRIKVAPEAARTPGIAEAERTRGVADAEALSMADVTRAWQMLLKGLQETRAAPQPIQAAEMVLIRLAYAARLPTPAEAIRGLDPGAGAAPPPPASPAPRSAARTPSSRGDGALASLVPQRDGAASIAPGLPRADRAPPKPAIEPAAEPATEPGDGSGRPRSFGDVVDLVRRHKEAILYGHLVADVRLVRFETGRIEINASGAAPADLPQRLSRFLSERTGERWLVTVSREAGQPSLLEQRQVEAAAHLRAIEDDPLIREIMRVFPGATIEQVRMPPPVDEPAAGDEEQE
jgi:DNA polymerase-3 subunit gamma/tau